MGEQNDMGHGNRQISITHKPGGYISITQGDWTTQVTKTSQDKRGLGRWTTTHCSLARKATFWRLKPIRRNSLQINVVDQSIPHRRSRTSCISSRYNFGDLFTISSSTAQSWRLNEEAFAFPLGTKHYYREKEKKD